MENNEILGEMFDLDQTSPNITKHDVWSPNKVCKRSNISPNMMLDRMLGEMLDRLHKPVGKILEICKAPIVNIEYFMICRNWKTVSVQLSFQYPEILEMCWDLFPCSYF